jgi:hypothetical protein
MLFSAPGKWKVVFAQRSELLGSVTLEVGPELLGVVGCPHRQSRSRRWHDGLVEVKGTAKGGQLWALLEQPSSDRAEKIVWRMTGSGELSLVAVNTSGGWVLPDQLSLHSLGSTWDRPGSEWGSVFTFHRPGCWDVHAQRGSLVGDVWLSVR